MAKCSSYQIKGYVVGVLTENNIMLNFTMKHYNKSSKFHLSTFKKVKSWNQNEFEYNAWLSLVPSALRSKECKMYSKMLLVFRWRENSWPSPGTSSGASRSFGAEEAGSGAWTCRDKTPLQPPAAWHRAGNTAWDSFPKTTALKMGQSVF